MPKDKEMIDFVHDIDFSDDIKPKLEIKEEPMDAKSCFDNIKIKAEFKEETSFPNAMWYVKIVVKKGMFIVIVLIQGLLDLVVLVLILI